MRTVRRRGLRRTVMGTFAAGALLISAVLAVGTYFSARHYLVQQRERTAERQAFSNAAIVRQGLLAPKAQVSEVLGAVSPSADSAILVQRDGRWYSSSLDMASDLLPAEVKSHVEDGSAAMAWSSGTHPSAIVVGLPLPDTGADYYEVAVARELDGTLTTLRKALVVSAGVTLLGGVLLGWVASRRLLSPLHAVTDAATRISAGDLGARLRPTSDPDLGALVGAFNNMVDALDERIRRDSRFAADIGHELRSPMTTLMTSVSVIRRDEGLPSRTRRAVQMMDAELERFRQSLDDLLEIGSLEAGVVEADLAPVDLPTFLTHLLATDGRPASLLEVDGATGLTSGQLDVMMDRRRLARAFVNLFVNADLHGQGLETVRVREARQEFVDVWVDDSGVGVPPQERGHIFERFARAGSRGSRTGTGLGLSIVAEIVDLHGGCVWCTDADRAGARFVVRLPLAKDSSGEGR